MRKTPSPTLLTVVSFFVLGSQGLAQAAPRPALTTITNVALDRANPDSIRSTLVLRDGRIESVLAADTPAPPGSRIVDGTALIALPAFLDAFTKLGVSTPQPKIDQDLPIDVKADVAIDMRHANRKGIQPAFRAVEALALTKEHAKAWREAGFGAALVAPAGELLAGTSALAATREAAMRDLVVRADVFMQAAFAASGPDYPSTPMGYMAQLRQFFLDSAHQRELERRNAQGRPGTRPPFDAELAAGAAVLEGRPPLLCQAEDAHVIERWFRLADELHLPIGGIAGGVEAWKSAELLARRGVSVVLTLDWGKEIEDPEEKKKPEEEPETTQEVASTGASEVAETDDAAPDAQETLAEPDWTYEEPLEIRKERRRLWLERRDGALRLSASGVRFAFGSGSERPDELLSRVRTLVKVGLPSEDALAALTTDAAEFLGVGQRLGRIAPGYDATLSLWTADPLVDEKAQVLWSFVDGFASEFERKAMKPEGKPAEGVDPSGTWSLAFDAEGDGPKNATLMLKLMDGGELEGTIEVENPMDMSMLTSSVSGTLSGKDLWVETTLSFGGFEIEIEITGTVDGDAMSGEVELTPAGATEAEAIEFEGTKTPGTIRESA